MHWCCHLVCVFAGYVLSMIFLSVNLAECTVYTFAQLWLHEYIIMCFICIVYICFTLNLLFLAHLWETF